MSRLPGIFMARHLQSAPAMKTQTVAMGASNDSSMNRPSGTLAPECPSACPHSTQCSLYEEFGNGRLLGIWKDRYCNTRYETCVRFQYSRIGEVVPPTLLPNGKLLR